METESNHIQDRNLFFPRFFGGDFPSSNFHAGIVFRSFSEWFETLHWLRPRDSSGFGALTWKPPSLHNGPQGIPIVSICAYIYTYVCACKNICLYIDKDLGFGWIGYHHSSPFIMIHLLSSSITIHHVRFVVYPCPHLDIERFQMDGSIEVSPCLTPKTTPKLQKLTAATSLLKNTCVIFANFPHLQNLWQSFPHVQPW